MIYQKKHEETFFILLFYSLFYIKLAELRCLKIDFHLILYKLGSKFDS